MDDYIKRQFAVEAAKHAWAKGLEPTQYIEEISAANVREDVHGEWEFSIFSSSDANDPRCKCSVCGSIETPLARHNFCPNCGARMDGDKQ